MIKMTVDEVDRSPTYANMKQLGFTDYYVSGGLNSPEDLYRGLHENMAQFREPPPYPGHSKQQPNQPGLRQSFSGSETSTDISLSSSENLSSSQRQEPQGEETQAQTAYSYDMSNPEYSILERLGMPTSAMDLPPQNTPAIYVTESKNKHGPHFATGPNQGPPYFAGSSDSGLSGSTTSSKVMWQDSPPVFDKSRFQNVPVSSSSSPLPPNHSTVSNYSNTTLYANYPVPYGAMDMQYSGPMFQNYANPLPPPPQYPGEPMFQSPEARRSYETIVKTEIPGSRSQPDLTRYYDYDSSGQKSAGMFYPESDTGSQQSIEQSFGAEPQYQGVEQIAAQATKMVKVLSDENRMLREKLNKLQKFELEIQKVHEAYISLDKSSKKREMLEQTMKKKMAEEIKKLKSQKVLLRDKLETAGIKVTDDQLAVQAEQQDSSMPVLLANYKELLAIKDRLEFDLQAQQTTIQEQRSQIEILRNVQANVLHLEEECRRQQLRSDFEEEIQAEFEELKTAIEKKEQIEKQQREKLEKDLEHCRLNHAHLATRKTDAMRDPKVDMQKRLDEKERKILQLEKEVIKWKECHLEESIRKLKLQGIDDDNRLPVYEQTSPSMDTESLINEAKTEKLKQMGEVYQANCKIAELEAKVKSLSSQLKEKEAMLRVYQRSSPMTRSSSVHTLYCSPRHSPRPSLIASGSLSRQDSQDMSTFREFKHKKTGSTSALETSCKMSQDDLFEKIRSLQSENKGESETEDDTASGNIWQV